MARLDEPRERIDAGLAAVEAAPIRSRYLDLHLDAVGVLGGKTLGRAGVEVGWHISKRTSAYLEANVLSDKTWNAGAGYRWRF